jgi:hypothetical protein
VNAALSKAWFFANPFSFVVLGPNVFLFKFKEKEHITRILSKVWNVNGFLLAIQIWSPLATLRDLSLQEVSFWIQVHGLPLQNMTLKNSIAIGKGLGQLVKVDENSGVAAIFRSFLRLLVSIDVSKPLNPGFCFSRSDGASDWISLQYERLDIYCTDCGKIGHKQPSCLAKPKERNPSRYLISLKINGFSNMPATISLRNQPVYLKTPPSSPEIFLSTPGASSSQPHANLQKHLTSSQNPSTNSQNPLTPQTSALWSHNPKTGHSPLSHCPTSPAAASMDIAIEKNLKALSLFQKPVKLFTSNQNPPTNLTNPNTSSESNQIAAA